MKDKKCIFKLIGAVVTVAAAVTAIIVFRKEIMNFLTAVKEKVWELVQRCKCMCCTDDCDSCSCCEDCGCDCCEDDYDDAELVAEADYVEEAAEAVGEAVEEAVEAAPAAE